MGKNNEKYVEKAITRDSYTHIFTSTEIALSKKFKFHIFDDLILSTAFYF